MNTQLYYCALRGVPTDDSPPHDNSTCMPDNPPSHPDSDSSHESPVASIDISPVDSPQQSPPPSSPAPPHSSMPSFHESPGAESLHRRVWPAPAPGYLPTYGPATPSWHGPSPSYTPLWIPASSPYLAPPSGPPPPPFYPSQYAPRPAYAPVPPAASYLRVGPPSSHARSHYTQAPAAPHYIAPYLFTPTPGYVAPRASKEELSTQPASADVARWDQPDEHGDLVREALDEEVELTPAYTSFSPPESEWDDGDGSSVEHSFDSGDADVRPYPHRFVESQRPAYLPASPSNLSSLEDNPFDDGTRLFADIFSRADKNEDGGLTFQEFQDHFGDDILSATEMVQLFKVIDLNASHRIDLSELEKYFRQGYSPYATLFSSVVQVQQAMLRALQHSHRTYPHEEPFERFRTRVFLAECQRQLQSLEKSIQSALDQLRQLSYQERGSVSHVVRSQESRPPREEHLNEDVQRLREQVDALSELSERLMLLKPRMASQAMVEEVAHEEDSQYVVISRAMQVQPEMNMHFRDATRLYIQKVKAEQGNQLVYVRKEVNENSFVVYEIWEDESYLAIHNHSPAFRAYQKELVDCLEQPTTVHTLPLPASWWS